MPAPSTNSALVATLTSLPSAISVPSAECSAAASGKLAYQPGRLSARETVPAATSTVPGEPTPTPRSCDGCTEAALAASVNAAAMALATSAGPPVVGVGWRALPSTL